MLESTNPARNQVMEEIGARSLDHTRFKASFDTLTQGIP
jgi:hypothetical protein